MLGTKLWGDEEVRCGLNMVKQYDLLHSRTRRVSENSTDTNCVEIDIHEFQQCSRRRSQAKGSEDDEWIVHERGKTIFESRNRSISQIYLGSNHGVGQEARHEEPRLFLPAVPLRINAHQHRSTRAADLLAVILKNQLLLPLTTLTCRPHMPDHNWDRSIRVVRSLEKVRRTRQAGQNVPTRVVGGGGVRVVVVAGVIESAVELDMIEDGQVPRSVVVGFALCEDEYAAGGVDDEDVVRMGAVA